MVWVFLTSAILSEVVGATSLRMAVDRGRKWYIGVALGFIGAFFFLNLTLAGGMPLGVAYGIWTASGVALAALVSRVLFKEPLTKVMGLGILLVIAGVVLVELGSLA